MVENGPLPLFASMNNTHVCIHTNVYDKKRADVSLITLEKLWSKYHFVALVLLVFKRMSREKKSMTEVNLIWFEPFTIKMVFTLSRHLSKQNLILVFFLSKMYGMNVIFCCLFCSVQAVIQVIALICVICSMSACEREHIIHIFNTKKRWVCVCAFTLHQWCSLFEIQSNNI